MDKLATGVELPVVAVAKSVRAGNGAWPRCSTGRSRRQENGAPPYTTVAHLGGVFRRKSKQQKNFSRCARLRTLRTVARLENLSLRRVAVVFAAVHGFAGASTKRHATRAKGSAVGARPGTCDALCEPITVNSSKRAGGLTPPVWQTTGINPAARWTHLQTTSRTLRSWIFGSFPWIGCGRLR